METQSTVKMETKIIGFIMSQDIVVRMDHSHHQRLLKRDSMLQSGIRAMRYEISRAAGEDTITLLVVSHY